MRHIICCQDFERQWIDDVFGWVPNAFRVIDRGGSHMLNGKRMAVLFNRESWRTRSALESAMKFLGGEVVFSTTTAREFSSGIENETLPMADADTAVLDTIRELEANTRPDVIAFRYDLEGGSEFVSRTARCSIINAGEGETGQHPLQALLDFFTIEKVFGYPTVLTIAMVGDLSRGRTIRSLAYLLAKFCGPGIKMYFVSPTVAKIPEGIKEYLERHNVAFFEECADIREIAGEVDVIYLTGIRKERQALLRSYERHDRNGFYVMTRDVLDLMKPTAIVMHPLPRRAELPEELDTDPRAAYIRQSTYRLPLFMSVLRKLILDNPTTRPAYSLDPQKSQQA